MKKILILLFLFSIMPFTACDDDENVPYDPNYAVCGVTNATENLPWLKDLVDKGPQLIEVKEYQGEDYIRVQAWWNSVATGMVYDCQGNMVSDSDIRAALSSENEGWICIYDINK